QRPSRTASAIAVRRCACCWQPCSRPMAATPADDGAGVVSSVPLSLYIHVPWCIRKCPYCDFNSHEASVIPEQDYLRALLNDLRQDHGLSQGREIRTIFIGGGTPSLFAASSYAQLLQDI